MYTSFTTTADVHESDADYVAGLVQSSDGLVNDLVNELLLKLLFARLSNLCARHHVASLNHS